MLNNSIVFFELRHYQVEHLRDLHDFFGCFGKCFVNLCGYIVYRLFFYRACGNLVIVTFRHIWLALKLDIKVSDYAIILKPPKLR